MQATKYTLSSDPDDPNAGGSHRARRHPRPGARVTPFSAIQIPYSLVERNVEHELLAMARALDLAVTGWAPLGGGLLTGRYGTDRSALTEDRRVRRPPSERDLAIADALNAVAEARGLSSTQVAIAWVLAQQRRAVTIPIIGVRTEAHLVDTLRALDVSLSAEELERLDEASRVAPGFPGSFGGEVYAHGDTLGAGDGSPDNRPGGLGGAAQVLQAPLLDEVVDR